MRIRLALGLRYGARQELQWSLVRPRQRACATLTSSLSSTISQLDLGQHQNAIER